MVLSEVFHHNVHQRQGFFIILATLGYIRTLGRNQREKNASSNQILCLFSGDEQENSEMIMLLKRNVMLLSQ